MTSYRLTTRSKKETVRVWPFRYIATDKNKTLSQLEKETLATWKEAGYTGRSRRSFVNGLFQKLTRLTEPIEAALIHCGYQRAGGRFLACRNLLLNEMHKRQTSLWSWDEHVWVEIAGYTYEEFNNIHKEYQQVYFLSVTHYRQCVLICAYLLGEVPIYQRVTNYTTLTNTYRIFGEFAVNKAIRALEAEGKRVGRGANISNIISATCSALLANRDPLLENITLSVLENLYHLRINNIDARLGCALISNLLYSLKILPGYITFKKKPNKNLIGIKDTLSTDWIYRLQAWFDGSTIPIPSRKQVIAAVAKAARWAIKNYPATANAHQWTRAMVIAYKAEVDRMTVGQWQHPNTKSTYNWGKPITSNYKVHLISNLGNFFKNCHEWDWFPILFAPDRYLSASKIKRIPNPRAIAPEQWAKLREAGLSLNIEDLSPLGLISGKGANCFSPQYMYPIEMVRAITTVWHYTGLRISEIYRLRVGCIRPIISDINESQPSLSNAICSLHVPVGKANFSFTKPVAGVVGTSIEIWEKIRPDVPKHWDYRTAEAVDFLFVWRGKRVGKTFINNTIIPALCRKAGISIVDARGKITSHRARHTIATQLSRADIPMKDSELTDWMGHLSLSSLKNYVEEDSNKLNKAYADANKISLSKRQLDELIPSRVIEERPTNEKETFSHHDLGQGVCTYDFFDQCRNRTACKKCSFYRPKTVNCKHIIEAKEDLVRLLKTTSLSDEARKAINTGITAYETLIAYLQSN